jgi:hypothetical protein
MDVQPYLTEQDVSRIIKRALPTLRNDRHLGKGVPYIRCGRSIRYNLDDVIKYMEARKISTETD